MGVFYPFRWECEIKIETQMNPVTELAAVNIMLTTIGAAPVAQLEGVQNEDVIVARSLLAQIVHELQTKEWHFNTEDDYPFTPDNKGCVYVPSNITRIMPMLSMDVTIRGTRLYDRKNHTYRFEHPFNAFVVLQLPFDDIPLEARLYVTIRAARRFQMQSLGDTSLQQWTQQDEYMAQAAFEAADMRQRRAYMGVCPKFDPISKEDLNRWRP